MTTPDLHHGALTRSALRAWLEANPQPNGRQLARTGLVVPHWPRPWGLSASPADQLMIQEEIDRMGIVMPRNPVAINNCGQTLLTDGTEEMRERFLWPALSGDEVWCMLFSEPSGGSDLSAVRTTAVRQGDHYIVNGQKIWTSLAHHARRALLVARTDVRSSRHAGLSQFLIDMDSPGVTVRPIIDMTGRENEYNEVFLDDVKVPASRILGKEGDGWRIAMTQLQTERVALSRPGAIWGNGPSARELLTGLFEVGALEHGAIRDHAADLYIEGEALRLLANKALADRVNARAAGPEGALRKMLAAPHGQKVMTLAKRIQGLRGLVEDAQPFPGQTGRKGPRSEWDHNFWFSPAITIGVGTQEILKNIVGERVLGLPREPRSAPPPSAAQRSER
ncbi:MAG: acyl-CoA dehydrogenase family protein [Burkholderiaceae bacterium]